MKHAVQHQIQHIDGEWLDCSPELHANASGLNTRIVPIPPTQEPDPCQSSPN